MNSTSATSKLTARVHNLVLSSMLLALAYVLPFFTGNIPKIGSMLLPMHLPVLLCSFLCGGSWGAAVGFAAPLIRSALLGAPAAYPTALATAFELAAYSLLYRHLPQTSLGIYASLLAAMVAGRVVWGGIMPLLLMNSDGFTLTAFVVGSFTNAIPGILLQLIAVPPLVMTLQQAQNHP